MSIVKAGKKAPKFKAENQDGKIVSLDDYKGKKLVLYFYPKDNTPTCTTEACNLRDNYKKLLKEGYTVLGVSPDSQKKHQNFIKKYKLPFDLLADLDHKIADAYGVWGGENVVRKKVYGCYENDFYYRRERQD